MNKFNSKLAILAIFFIFAAIFCYYIALTKKVSVNENVVPAHVQVSEFNNVPGQCVEFEKNTGKIPVYKLAHTYKLKVTFIDSSFSATKHLSVHADDVAMIVETGDKTAARVVILTDNLPTHKYLSAGYH